MVWIEESVRRAIEWGILGLEVVSAVIIFVGAAEAAYQFARYWRWLPSGHRRRAIRVGFGQYLVLALEFQVGSDVLKVALDPTLQTALVVALVVAIRVVLAWFMEREIAHLETQRHDHGA